MKAVPGPAGPAGRPANRRCLFCISLVSLLHTVLVDSAYKMLQNCIKWYNMLWNAILELDKRSVSERVIFERDHSQEFGVHKMPAGGAARHVPETWPRAGLAPPRRAGRRRRRASCVSLILGYDPRQIWHTQKHYLYPDMINGQPNHTHLKARVQSVFR